jgi:hypothetical protein
VCVLSCGGVHRVQIIYIDVVLVVPPPLPRARAGGLCVCAQGRSSTYLNAQAKGTKISEGLFGLIYLWMVYDRGTLVTYPYRRHVYYYLVVVLSCGPTASYTG